jgi:mitochondrial fission protein ELM1
MDSISCWVVTDGKAGMESQCLGLAEALGLEPVVKRVALKTPWRQLTPYFRYAQGLGFARDSDRLEAPWPDLVIATGRHSVAAALYTRAKARRSGKKTILVQLQKPALGPSNFDLVITPMHDGLKAENVIATYGALHRISQDKLLEGAAEFRPLVKDLPQPYIGVLLGGANAAYSFSPEDAKELGSRLAIAARVLGGSLLITPSRRTDAACGAAFKEALGDVPYFYWDGEGANPYFGILGLAEFLVATCDSVNMVSEALATAKPVYVAALRGGTPKFERFHRTLREAGLTRAFEGALERYSYAPPNDMHVAVERIRTLLGRDSS